MSMTKLSKRRGLMALNRNGQRKSALAVFSLRYQQHGVPLGIKIAQKPYIVWSLVPKALIYESLDP